MTRHLIILAAAVGLAACAQQEEPMGFGQQYVTVPDGTVTVDGVEYMRKGKPTQSGGRIYYVVVDGRTFKCDGPFGDEAGCRNAVERGLRAEENQDDGDDY